MLPENNGSVIRILDITRDSKDKAESIKQLDHLIEHIPYLSSTCSQPSEQPGSMSGREH